LQRHGHKKSRRTAAKSAPRNMSGSLTAAPRWFASASIPCGPTPNSEHTPSRLSGSSSFAKPDRCKACGPLFAPLRVRAGFLPHLVPRVGSRLPDTRQRGPGPLSLPRRRLLCAWVGGARLPRMPAAVRRSGFRFKPLVLGNWAAKSAGAGHRSAISLLAGGLVPHP
jgi:hypothetical protein